MLKYFKMPKLFFNSLKLKYKFIIFYLLVVLLPVIIIGIIFTSRITKTTLEQSMNESITSLNIVRDNLKNNIKIVEDISDYISLNSIANMEISRQFKNPSDSFSLYIDTFYPVIRDTKNIHSRFIKDLTIYTINDTIIPNGSEIEYVSEDIKKQSWYEKAVKLSGKRLWTNSIENDEINGKKIYRISLCRCLNYFSYSTSKDVLKIDVDEEYFYNLINDDSGRKIFYLINPNGDIVSSNDRSKIGKQADNISYLKGTFLNDNGWYNIYENFERSKVIYNTLSTETGNANKWRLISVIPFKYLYESMNEARNFGVVICIFSLTIISILVFAFSEGITKRIGILADKTQKVSEGDFEEIVDMSGNDEIAELGRSFNKMLSNLNQLIKENYENKINLQEYELKKKEAELNALQNQINPHFLYNTLDAIRMHAILSDNDELGDMLVSLASLFRYSISRGKEVVTINDEINYAENYINLLNIRLMDKIALKINASENLYNCKILKLVLQPLVENAYKHGLKTKKGDRSINISVYLNSSIINLEVEDNGVGITEENVEILNSELKELRQNEPNNSNIGLSNVNSRIKLYFGKEYGVLVSSKLGEGTKVSLSIPMQKEGVE